MILAALFFLFVIMLLVLVHEWGHFFVARKFGIKVEEFGFGFPPRIASRMKNGVRYSFNLLPLGGFVKIFGEQGEGEGDPASFISRPAWQRFLVIVAGVLMNFVLAWVLFSLAAGIGAPAAFGDEDAGARSAPVTVIGIAPNSPATEAGLQFGDAIEKVYAGGRDIAIPSVSFFQETVNAYRGEEIIITLKRGSDSREIAVTPRVNPPQGEGAIGVALARVAFERSPWYRAPWDGFKMFLFAAEGIVVGVYSVFRELFTTGRLMGEVSGPVGIFIITDQARSLGFSYILNFIAILSVNLGVLNFLPIPALDGGRMFFILIEKLKGTPVNFKFEQRAHTIGFAILIFLMLLVTYRDVVKLF
ncbi:MAG: RIP metalloprotease RseP [bacterium]|nr:RIP metalloprotease RseP [bacterium]